MGENYHATFHINLEISSKFVRTSRAVFNDPFLVKDRATLEGSSCTDIMTCPGGSGYSF